MTEKVVNTLRWRHELLQFYILNIVSKCYFIFNNWEKNCKSIVCHSLMRFHFKHTVYAGVKNFPIIYNLGVASYLNIIYKKWNL
jgi:hypothetical protein